MKMQGQILTICLLLSSFNLPHSLKAELINPLKACPETEMNYTTNIIKDSKCLQYTVNKLDESILDEVFNLRTRNLVLIIAHDTKDAITLAQFFTHRNIISPQKKREDFSDKEKPIYDFMLQNFQVYENLDIKTAFFVYPRNTNNENLAKQIVVEVLKLPRNVKIILTLPNPSHELGITSFLRKRMLHVKWIFEDAAKVIRNLEKYADSSFLVVTNGTFSGNYVDSEKDLRSDKRNEDDYRNVIDIYTKEPDSNNNGKLLANYMTVDKRNIVFAGGFTPARYKKLIEHLTTNVKHTIAKIFDFETQTHLYLDCMFNLTNTKLTSNINSLESIINRYFSLEETNSNMSTLSGCLTFSEKLDLGYESLSSFLNCMLKNDMNLFNSCFNNFNESIQHLRISRIHSIISESYKYFEILCTVRAFSGYLNQETENYINHPEKWALALKNYTEGTLRGKKDWYHKLKTTFYNVDSLSETEISNSLQDLLNELTDNAKKYNLNAMANAHNMVKSKSVKTRTTFSCLKIPNGLKLQVTGKILKLSQIINMTHCTENYKILEIFALDTIVIDRDLVSVGEELNVFIFSPIWEVVWERNIILDGASRSLIEDHLDPKAENGNKILNRHGAHGHAGLPGGPAGILYGLADTIIKGENLRIFLNGGNGSNGQDGGDASDSEDGEAPSEIYIKSVLDRYSCIWRSSNTLNYKVEPSKIYNTYYEATDTQGTYSSDPPPKVEVAYECYIYGFPALKGGRGGNGGVKGMGGIVGDYKLFMLNDSVDIPVVFLASNGTEGRNGVGGKKGKGGFTRKITLRNIDLYAYKIVENVTIDRAFDGENGKNGTCTIGSKLEKEATVLQSFSQTTNLYKQYILSNFLTHNDAKYIDLYKQVINNKNVHKTYDTLTLVNELTDLEQHYYKLENKSDAILLYQSWRERLLDYFSHRKDSEKTQEYSKIIRSLDNIVSEKINRLVKNSNSHQIFRLAEYLTECKEDVKHLHNAETVSKIKNVNSHYTEEFDDKIEEAQRIIHEDLQKEIDENNNQLNGETETLLQQIVALTQKERENEDAQAKNFKSMEFKVIFKTFTDIFDIINTGIGLLNPSLAAIGRKVSEASSSIQKFFEDKSADEDLIGVKIPKIIDRSRELYNIWTEAKKEYQKLTVEENLATLQEEKKKLQKKGEDTKPLNSLEASIKDLGKTMASNKLPAEDVLKVLDDKLVKEESIWQKIKNATDEEIYDGVLKIIELVKTASRIKVMAGDLFKNIKSGDAGLKSVSKNLNKAFEETQKLRNFKEEVYTDMVPILEKIRETTDITGKVSSSSIAYLDFEKFKMEKYFEEVLNKLENFIKEFEVEASFAGTLKNMKKAIDMILSTYSRIQQYVGTMKMVNYEKDLSLAPFDITYVKDAKLGTALASMIQSFYANIVLDDYYKWMASFKQYAFPFAEKFIGVTESPIPEVDDLLTRAEEAGKRFESYDIILRKKGAELKEFEKSILAEFGDNRSPFHIWNNSIYLNEINDILEGNKVTLFANIDEHVFLNAVKFSNIGLRFRSTDPNVKYDDIKRDLYSFSVKLSHSGDSYYRCDDRVFLIFSKSHEFEKMYNEPKIKHECENAESGTSVGKRESDYILSPYATWTIELVIRDDNENFEALKKYKSKVNVELIGKGRFTDKNIEVCNSNLSKYYENEL